MEFLSRNKSVEYKGLSLFYTGEKGAYMGNFIGKQQHIVAEIEKFIPLSLLDEVKDLLVSFLEEQVAPFYEGYLGVDMLVYAQNNRFFLQPCVEINLRSNMGVIALKISQNILSEQSTGRFQIDFNAQTGQIRQRHLKLRKACPQIVENGKLLSGYLPLCPVTDSSRYHAYAVIVN
jgi:hypothetical protein